MWLLWLHLAGLFLFVGVVLFFVWSFYLSGLFYLWGLLCAEFCYMLWVARNTHSRRKNITENIARENRE